MRINRRLLPIKAHFFLFMGSLGPILPQLPVYGKELGISTVVMGTITGILPLLFLFAKPLFGMLVDVYRDYRKTIFMAIICIMVLSFALMNFIPPESRMDVYFSNVGNVLFENCTAQEFLEEQECNNQTLRVTCTSNCSTISTSYLMSELKHSNSSQQYKLCYWTNDSLITVNDSLNSICDMKCAKDFENHNGCLYKSFTFWSFVILMYIGSIGFNVINSITDAICFDIIGEEYDYGKQRVWGTIGWGLSALFAGYIVDLFSGTSITYTPAFIIMLVLSVFDLSACIKLKLPVMKAPENMFKEIKHLMNNRHVVIFITFAVFAGIVDSFIIYYLFWYVEDFAKQTGTTNIKLLEGLILAAETLGGEVIFFSLAGKILKRFGHVHCFSMCFVNYALRYGLISVVPSPWWIVPIEFVFQGPTYAMTYTTIVEYANELAPPGTSATMQGIAAGMDDGFGYAIGSFIAGILYKYIGGRNTMHLFSVFGVLCSITHLVLHKTYLKNKEGLKKKENVSEYKSPDEAVKITYDT
ncbi:unnamed protein product [Acanthoscelides obtectus]|uniref:Major facilitator superfamily (MFS) profile domain-containing protein n=1 Tax=Acanthoscelides obtectus TaxID=200917 RepID=A0A9P0JQG2_ACAOB|nr:unnamed protein product [Acanthoscelides obtectus]CAK1663791.1 Major facilitator superfamily domain-containing protein 6 [Acanthoscelides obtectus]